MILLRLTFWREISKFSHFQAKNPFSWFFFVDQYFESSNILYMKLLKWLFFYLVQDLFVCMCLYTLFMYMFYSWVRACTVFVCIAEPKRAIKNGRDREMMWAFHVPISNIRAMNWYWLNAYAYNHTLNRNCTNTM